MELALELAVVALSVLTAGHALLYKRNPRPTSTWVLVCLLLPGVGAAAYWMFGHNRVLTRRARLQRDWHHREGQGDRRGAIEILKEVPERYRELCSIGSRVTGRPLLSGNRVQPLVNGNEAYPRMLTAIRAAESSIWLGTYIFDRDTVGREFVAALSQAVDRGVDVRVLIDGLGEWYSPRRIGGLLMRHGVQVVRFIPPSLIPPQIHVNLRYHRKLLIVDGALAFTGGMNIGRRHMVESRSKRRFVRDLHFEVEGPVVAQMEDVFREDWCFASGDVEESIGRPRELEAVGGTHARAISAGPNEDMENLRWILLGALSGARESVRIMTPYFIAETSIVAALNAASLRGVRVELILPERNNLVYMKWAARSQLWQLLEFGVRVMSQPGTFSHTKFLIIDDDYALIGSANVDPRSMRLNFEFNLEICGGDCPPALVRHFEGVLAESREITLEELDARPLWIRLRDAIAALFSPYL